MLGELRNIYLGIGQETLSPDPGSVGARRPLPQEDEQWLTAIEETVARHLSNPHFTASEMANLMHTSRATLNRKIGKFTGMTPAQYLLEARFLRAKQLLETGACSSVKKAAYSVGFLHVKHFSKQFKRRYGVSPSHYFAPR